MNLKQLLFLKAANGEPQTVEATATGNPATFTTDIQKPLVALSVTFDPVQAGTGDPSEENVRNITGRSSVTVSVGDGEGTPMQYTTNLGGTYYSGTLNVLTGELLVTWQFASGRWGNIKTGEPNPDTGFYQGQLVFDRMPQQAVYPQHYGERTLCNCMNNVLWGGVGETPEHYYIPGSSGIMKAYLFGNFDDDLVVQVAVALAEPFSVQLTGQQVSDLLGANSIAADTNGTVSVTYLKLA